LNLEVEARMKSSRDLENKLLSRLLELNPFELPQRIVDSTLDRMIEDAKEKGQTITPDEEEKVREQYRPGVEQNYRADILIDAVGKAENIEVTDEELDNEIASFAEQESKPPAQVKAQLKKEGNFDRLRNDLHRRQVIDKLVEKADIENAKKSEPTEETEVEGKA
jgi:trigger factor